MSQFSRGTMSNAETPNGGDVAHQGHPSGVGGSPAPAKAGGCGCSTSAGLVFILAGIGMFILYYAAELDKACYPDEYSTGFCGLDFFVLAFAWTLLAIGLITFIATSVLEQKASGKSGPPTENGSE